MEWKPIETAPTDGTEVDLWQFCHTPSWRPIGHGIEKGMRITGARWANGAWEQYNDYWGDWVDLSHPDYTISHWMPVAKPPK